ncbi:uncharacterized protein LOC143615443 [Bidens hawaiensis]|uniref:uncharacterized protein LOC143615443 n=1 Tax=Bidens hawaiensis TaxID=980011 RepID=UPI00404ADCC6
MSAVEYQTILKYCLTIPLFPVDQASPICRKVCLDSFGEHVVHCMELPRDLDKKEPPVNFLSDPLEGSSTLQPTDVLVFGYVEGARLYRPYWSIPLLGLGIPGF